MKKLITSLTILFMFSSFANASDIKNIECKYNKVSDEFGLSSGHVDLNYYASGGDFFINKNGIAKKVSVSIVGKRATLSRIGDKGEVITTSILLKNMKSVHMENESTIGDVNFVPEILFGKCKFLS